MPYLSGSWYWQHRLARWRAVHEAEVEPGYTLLLPVPGDIPVFLELALRVCDLQSATNRVGTLVVPDRPTQEVAQIVRRHRRDWDGPLDLQLLPRPERWLLPYLRSGSRNHGLQLIAGVEATTSTHIVLHDADLFLLDCCLLDQQYELCRDRELACLGVSPVWDPWFAEHGRHLAATWELTASVEWLRKWEPWRHMGHNAELWSEGHSFDTTLWAQAHTPAEQIDHTARADSFVHFNYVITSYRHYQRQRAAYVDANFRVLLIGLFVEVFANTPSQTDIPSVTDLARGLAGSGPVQYPAPHETERGVYADFRRRLRTALRGPYMQPGETERAEAALRPFDEYYEYADRTGPVGQGPVS